MGAHGGPQRRGSLVWLEGVAVVAGRRRSGNRALGVAEDEGGPAAPLIGELAGPDGRRGRLQSLPHRECLGCERLAAAGGGDVAQCACCAGVAGGACAADGNDVIEVLDDGVVGRPNGRAVSMWLCRRIPGRPCWAARGAHGTGIR